MRFGRIIFDNYHVCDSKPNGTYLIPIICLATNGRHWHLLAISKAGKRKIGFHVDSLGINTTNDEHLRRKFLDAFSPDRGHTVWNNTQCVLS